MSVTTNDYRQYLRILSGIGDVWLCGCNNCQSGYTTRVEATTSELLLHDCLYI